MIIKANSEVIRYTGRWNVTEKSAVTTANGSYFEFNFWGSAAVLAFDVDGLEYPYPHIYICVDGGAMCSAALDGYVRISCDGGEHSVKVIAKSSSERQSRWEHPLVARTAFVGVEAEEFLPIGEDDRPKIEFIGDSITEGISIDVDKKSYYSCQSTMADWDDSTAGYAWLTAEALDLRPYIMGYGCLGITSFGGGGVPPVATSYTKYSDGYQMPSVDADFVVLNHGTNDRNGDREAFKAGYFEFLGIIRKRNPRAKIIALTPFSGCLAEEIFEAVEKYNREFADSVYYVNSTGWITPEPIHPSREGHRTVSRHLVEIIKNNIL